MTDNPTRAKMAILNLTPDEIIEAIKLLPGPSDWRDLAVGTESLQLKRDLERVSVAAYNKAGFAMVGCVFDVNIAAYTFKCTPAQARDAAVATEEFYHGTLHTYFTDRLSKTYGDRPHNPDTMELIFDDHEIP